MQMPLTKPTKEKMLELLLRLPVVATAGVKAQEPVVAAALMKAQEPVVAMERHPVVPQNQLHPDPDVVF